MLPKKAQKLLNKVVKIRSDFDFILNEAFESSRKKIVQLNTVNQLFKSGVDNENKAIEPAYTPLTVSIKKRKGQPTNRVTLKDTGDFYRDTDVDFTTKDFTIINFNEKYQKLTEKYGDEILGLTIESQAILKNIVKDKVGKKLKNKLNYGL
tara:strand:- start:640 stop:1092 length:453 start_codon:yes stop_codon:yes gene_type:complete